MIDSNDKGRAMPASPPQQRILLVEDDLGIAREVVAELDARGYATTHVVSGEAAVALAPHSAFDLAIIDRLLPGIDGLEVISRLRAANWRLPVLVASALSAVDERVRGLKAGGDDYLVKPFALTELAARVEALLRRPVDRRENVLRVGPLTLDLIDRVARRGAREFDLLQFEFKLLDYLMRRPGQTVTRAMLLEDVWNYRFALHSNVVDVHMGKLRRKIDAPGEPPMITSVWGSGFVLNAPD